MNEITCEVYESRRLLTWSWRFRFIAANGRTLGHQYNNLTEAIAGANLIVNSPVRLVVIDRDGRRDDRGLIRS